MFLDMDLENKNSPVLVVDKTREDTLNVVDTKWEDMLKAVDRLECKQLFEEEDKVLVDMLLNEVGTRDMETVFDKLLLVLRMMEQST